MEKYKDANASVEERVEDLLGRMTLEEKVAQLCGDLPYSVVRKGKVDHDALRKRFPDGHGRFTQYSMVGLADPVAIAELSNEIQRYFVEETRLGIPVALQSEDLCGYPAAGGTLFPSMMNVAATWEPALAEKMSSVIGQEARAVGISSSMSPVIDVSRDPRWGRTYETFGEDPYLVTQMGVSYVRGMQGEDKDGTACIAKHFLGYSETQGGLNCAAARINDRELYEVFATPFEAAAKLADVSGVMANYGEIDGLNVLANPKISKTLLRETMGFKGMLTSDGGAVMRLWNFYHVASSHGEAAYLAKKAGCDTEIPVGAGFRQLPEYVRAGKLDEKCIDESVRRILTIKFVYGLFDHPYVDVDAVRASMTNSGKQALSREIAEKSVVLLKNDGTLPIQKTAKVALIGPHAKSLRYPVSGYTYPAYIEMLKGLEGGDAGSFGGIGDDEAARSRGGASEDKCPEKRPPSAFASMSSVISPDALDALEDMGQVLRGMGATTLFEELAKRYSVAYAEGCTIVGSSTEGFAEAVEAARGADVAVMALGGNCGWFNTTGGEGKDRSSLELPGVQEQLLEAVAATGTPVVVVLYGPGVFSSSWAAEHVGAIVEAWMPGQHAGDVIARALCGELNPSGKLPVTIPRRTGQVPIYYNHRTGSGYTDGADATVLSAIFSGGYVDCQDGPLYPFGHGLSYTTFKVSDLELSDSELPCDGRLRASCRVTNTGSLPGAEVVQLYTRFDGAHVTRPNKQLAAFARLELAPGAERRVTFEVDLSQLAYYNEDMRFVVEPGRLRVMVGTSAHDLPLEGAVELVGEAVDVMGRRAYCATTTTE